MHLAILAGGLIAAAAVLAAVLLRRSRTVEPVYCIHCWVHHKRVTVVTHASEGRRWAICQECVGLYWDFEGEHAVEAESERARE